MEICLNLNEANDKGDVDIHHLNNQSIILFRICSIVVINDIITNIAIVFAIDKLLYMQVDFIENRTHPSN